MPAYRKYANFEKNWRRVKFLPPVDATPIVTKTDWITIYGHKKFENAFFLLFLYAVVVIFQNHIKESVYSKSFHFVIHLQISKSIYGLPALLVEMFPGTCVWRCATGAVPKIIFETKSLKFHRLFHSKQQLISNKFGQLIAMVWNI